MLTWALVATAFWAALLDVTSPVTLSNPLVRTVGGRGGEPAFRAAGELVLSTGLLLGIVSLARRLHRARGRRRQQIKWFAFVGSLALAGVLPARFAAAAPDTEWVQMVGTTGWFVAVFFVTIGIPAAIGTAILRHELYDVDLVIRRTLVYGCLTLVLVAALAGVYAALLVGLPILIAPLTLTSDLAVAASTLVAAALFRPARGRIQDAVDRRFYRRRYDAVRTVESFAMRLRHEVDLAAVRGDLERVASDTLQPTHASLWLRDPW